MRDMLIIKELVEIHIILSLQTELCILAGNKILFFLGTDAKSNISYKNLLQEYLQKSGYLDLPVYQTERTFDVAELSIRVPPDFKLLTCQGKPWANKRGAEQECTKQACVELKIIV